MKVALETLSLWLTLDWGQSCGDCTCYLCTLLAYYNPRYVWIDFWTSHKWNHSTRTLLFSGFLKRTFLIYVICSCNLFCFLYSNFMIGMNFKIFIYLFILLLIDIWVVSSLRFWEKIILLWTFLYVSSGGCKHSFILGIYKGVQMQGQSRFVIPTLGSPAQHFQNNLYQFPFLPADDESSGSSTFLSFLSTLGIVCLLTFRSF